MYEGGGQQKPEIIHTWMLSRIVGMKQFSFGRSGDAHFLSGLLFTSCALELRQNVYVKFGASIIVYLDTPIDSDDSSSPTHSVDGQEPD